jgi:hypothetical protein
MEGKQVERGDHCEQRRPWIGEESRLWVGEWPPIYGLSYRTGIGKKHEDKGTQTNNHCSLPLQASLFSGPAFMDPSREATGERRNDRIMRLKHKLRWKNHYMI